MSLTLTDGATHTADPRALRSHRSPLTAARADSLLPISPFPNREWHKSTPVRLDCRHKLRWRMAISLVPRALIVVWLASIRCSLCGPLHRPLSFLLWSGLRSMYGA
jgi:hypothetical protein